MAKLWNMEIPGSCDGRKRNVYMAYLDGSEFGITLPDDPRDMLSDRFICFLQSLHFAISDFDILESTDEDDEKGRTLSFVWNGSDVRLHVCEGPTEALTLCRAAICAVFKTTKVSTLGRTNDITCELQ